MGSGISEGSLLELNRRRYFIERKEVTFLSDSRYFLAFAGLRELDPW